MYSWGFFYFLFCTMTNECTINWQFITQYMYAYQGKEEKEDVQEKRGWKVYEQPWKQDI